MCANAAVASSISNVELALASRAGRSAAHERDAALHREREPQLGLDVGADAVERIDERERELDRAAGIVLARDRQADDDAQRRSRRHDARRSA